MNNLKKLMMAGVLVVSSANTFAEPVTIELVDKLNNLIKPSCEWVIKDGNGKVLEKNLVGQAMKGRDMKPGHYQVLVTEIGSKKRRGSTAFTVKKGRAKRLLIVMRRPAE